MFILTGILSYPAPPTAITCTSTHLDDTFWEPSTSSADRLAYTEGVGWGLTSLWISWTLLPIGTWAAGFRPVQAVVTLSSGDLSPEVQYYPYVATMVFSASGAVGSVEVIFTESGQAVTAVVDLSAMSTNDLTSIVFVNSYYIKAPILSCLQFIEDEADALPVGGYLTESRGTDTYWVAETADIFYSLPQWKLTDTASSGRINPVGGWTAGNRPVAVQVFAANYDLDSGESTELTITLHMATSDLVITKTLDRPISGVLRTSSVYTFVLDPATSTDITGITIVTDTVDTESTISKIEFMYEL